jgi:hypothetical protein
MTLRFSHIKNQTADVVSLMIKTRHYADDRENNVAKYSSYQESVEVKQLAGRKTLSSQRTTNTKLIKFLPTQRELKRLEARH